jgi:UDP-glucose 4-epimerase
MTPQVVLVTGVGGYLGGNLAARLAANPDIDRVLGVDTVPPPKHVVRSMGRAEFVRADIRNPLIAKVITAANVDTVIHASTTTSPPGAWCSRNSTSSARCSSSRLVSARRWCAGSW